MIHNNEFINISLVLHKSLFMILRYTRSVLGNLFCYLPVQETVSYICFNYYISPTVGVCIKYSEYYFQEKLCAIFFNSKEDIIPHFMFIPIHQNIALTSQCLEIFGTCGVTNALISICTHETTELTIQQLFQLPSNHQRNKIKLNKTPNIFPL